MKNVSNVLQDALMNKKNGVVMNYYSHSSIFPFSLLVLHQKEICGANNNAWNANWSSHWHSMYKLGSQIDKINILYAVS